MALPSENLWVTLSENAMAALKCHNMEKFEELMATISVHEHAGRRMYGHLRGKKALIEGHYAQSIEILCATQATEGNNVALLSDLATAYYLSGRYGLWQSTVSLLQSELGSVRSRLHSITLARTEIILGRFLEETGLVDEAVKLFRGLSRGTNVSFRQRGLVNLLRLEAQYQLTSSLSHYYAIVKQLTLGTDQPDLDPEALHSICLSEAEFISFDLAIKSLALIPKNKINFIDLTLFDLLEIALRKKNATMIHYFLGQIRERPTPIHEFEKCLLQVATGEAPQDWFRWSGQMPLANYLRLMGLLLQLPSFQEKELSYNQTVFMVQGLPRSNRRIWNATLQLEAFGHSSASTLVRTEEGFYLGGKPLKLKKQSLLFQLIALVYKTGRISVEEATRFLWNSSYDSTYGNRMRQLVIRINKYCLKQGFWPILNLEGAEVYLVAQK